MKLLFVGVLVCSLASAGVPLVPSTEAAKITVLYSFCSQQNCADGSLPIAGLIDVKGALYGTTYQGGANAKCGQFGEITCGALFSVKHKKSGETVLYSFCSQSNCADGAFPSAGLTDVGGTLYGTTAGGGAYGEGTVFSFDPKNGSYAVIHSFGGSDEDGWEPEAVLLNEKGVLYGTTFTGGANGCGTLFSIDLSTETETLLYTFGSERGESGCLPEGGLIDVKGTLYGITTSGGTSGYGVLYSYNLSTKTYAQPYSFGEYTSDGEMPLGGVINVAGALVGTTEYGGTGGCSSGEWLGCGTVFSFDPATKQEKVSYSFSSDGDGNYPAAGLTKLDGVLYGTTSEGGVGYGGTVFSFDPKLDSETVLRSFNGRGADPVASLLYFEGALYGTAEEGGANSLGIVFKIRP